MTGNQHIEPDALVLFAMHALDVSEAAVVEQHVRDCEQCSLQVAEARGDMALLAFAVDQVALPVGAEERFMARVKASSAVTTGEGLPRHVAPAEVTPIVEQTNRGESNVVDFESYTQPKRSKWPIVLPWAIAAAVSGLAITLGVENRNLNETVGAEAALLNNVSSKASHAQQIVDALNSPHAQRVTLTATKHAAEPTGQAIYLADRGSLLFQANNLKTLDAGKTYELWVIPADGKAPVPAGTFKPDATGYASVVLPTLPPGIAAKAFGVTIENAGGATTPTMPIILAGG